MNHQLISDTNSKLYYCFAILYSSFVVIFRIVTIYLTKLICDGIHNSPNITITKSNNESVIYEEAMIYELPIYAMIIICFFTFTILWAALENNKSVRLVLYGGLMSISFFNIFVNIIVYWSFHNQSNCIYQIYSIIFESGIVITSSFILIINCHSNKNEKLLNYYDDL